MNRYCQDCGFIIADNENFVRQSNTGFIYCEDCGAGHGDVNTYTPADVCGVCKGDSSSSAGNCIHCEGTGVRI